MIKKLFTIIMLSVLIIVSNTNNLCAHAVKDSDFDIYDIHHISDEEKNIIGSDGFKDTTIKLYHVSGTLSIFNTAGSIFEIIDKRLYDDILYVDILDDKIVSCKRINKQNNECESLDGSLYISNNLLSVILNKNDNIVFPSNTEIYSVYALCEMKISWFISGSVVCFNTNNGNYVYISHPCLYGFEYLMPETEFYDFVKVALEYMKNDPNTIGGPINIRPSYDLSEYNISRDFISQDTKDILKKQLTDEEIKLFEDQNSYQQSFPKKDLSNQTIIRVYRVNCFEYLDTDLTKTVESLSLQKNIITYATLNRGDYYPVEIHELSDKSLIIPIDDSPGQRLPPYVNELRYITDQVDIKGTLCDIREIYFLDDMSSKAPKYSAAFMITDKGNYVQFYENATSNPDIYTEEEFIKYGKAFYNYKNSPEGQTEEIVFDEFAKFIERGDIDKYLPETNRITESADTDNTNNKDSVSAYLVPVICAGVILVIAVAVIVKQKKSK